jgi:hypothetical protein
MTTTFYKDYPKSHAADIHKEKQVGGSHYKLPIEPIDYIEKNNLTYCEGNVVKYVTRHKNKKGAEDIKKAIHYLEFILKYQYGENV